MSDEGIDDINLPPEADVAPGRRARLRREKPEPQSADSTDREDAAAEAPGAIAASTKVGRENARTRYLRQIGKEHLI